MKKIDKVSDGGIPVQVGKTPLEILQDAVSIYFQDLRTEQEVVDYTKRVRERLFRQPHKNTETE